MIISWTALLVLLGHIDPVCSPSNPLVGGQQDRVDVLKQWVQGGLGSVPSCLVFLGRGGV
jgi:hypothetical protein